MVEQVSEMAEDKHELVRVDSLREEVRGPVGYLGQQLRADLGEVLESLCLVGSALTGDFDGRHSDINTVVVVKRRSHELLQRLAGYGGKMGKMKLAAPLLMTKEYIEESLDVFGVEFLDFQLNHAVVYGSDPFKDLEFAKKDIRLQCERQLKGALINLRQGYIRSQGKARRLGELLSACMGELSVLMRAMLWLVGSEREKEALATIEKAAATFEFEAEEITGLMKLKLEHLQPGAEMVEGYFKGVYLVVDHLGRKVDKLQVGT